MTLSRQAHLTVSDSKKPKDKRFLLIATIVLVDFIAINR